MASRRLLWALVAAAAGTGAPPLHASDPLDLLSLMQVTPAAVLERGAELGRGNASQASAATSAGAGSVHAALSRPRHREPHVATLLRDKHIWLLLELLGTGLLGFDRIFLGGGNVPMGLMKLLWNIPSLGLWSTIDRIAVVNNALSKASSVSVLGMYCGFSHSRVESAYLLGAICGLASLAVLGIWILLGMYLLWELARNPDTSVDWIILEVAAYVAGMNVAIALSVPLLALSVPLGFLLVVVQAWSLVRERWMHKSIFDTSSAADTLTINVVKAIGGEHLCTVEGDPSWIVARLKIAIRSDLGVPSQLQRLVCRNRPMLDSDHLRDHLAISRAGYFRRIFGGHREPRVLEVGLMQYQSLPECTPRASESLVDLVDHVDGILSVEGGDEVGDEK